MNSLHSRLAESLRCTKLKASETELMGKLSSRYENPGHGSYSEWKQLMESLPDISPSFVDLDQAAPVIGRNTDCTVQQGEALRRGLMSLSPWRKGPFDVFGILIDAEWRSDLKWSRIMPCLESLHGKSVLDIGCSNGYYTLRMQGAGAAFVLGIDPVWRYAFQFSALQKYLPEPHLAFVLPFRLEEFTGLLSGFDTAFSMGVLYHQRHPGKHLDLVYSLLRAGGQFLLETLIIESRATDALTPDGRYANMRNVWMVPSFKLVSAWLKAAGFIRTRLVDKTMTTVQEQRQTEWMKGYSLADALNPSNHHQTVEGHAAPLRACIIAEKPA